MAGSRTITSFNRPVNMHDKQIKSPTIGDEPSESPIRYLKDLENYITYFGLIDDPCLKFVLSQTLKSTALEWFNFIENSNNNFYEFVYFFRNRFWNDAIRMNYACPQHCLGFLKT